MKLLDRWHLARYLQRKADEGYELIPVPRYLASEVHVLVYTRGFERVADKWAARTAEVPLQQWQAATLARGERTTTAGG